MGFPFLFLEQRLAFLCKFPYSLAYHEPYYNTLVILSNFLQSILLEVDLLAKEPPQQYPLSGLQYVNSYILLFCYYFHSRGSTYSVYSSCYILLCYYSISYAPRCFYLHLISYHISHKLNIG